MSNKIHALPKVGTSYEEITQRVDDLLAEMTPEASGKLSSTAFWGTGESYNVVKETFAKFFSWNALFTFQESAAARMENDVIDICIGLVGGGEQSRGNLTSGGTESNFCAMHAMRNWAREHYPNITKPEVVAPYSIHSTIHKTAKILDIKVVVVPQNADLSADVDAIRAAINENTIGIASSAPNWPYGRVDPIEEIAEIARKKNLWLHVDACVGAYVLPFFRELGEEIPPYDLSVEGVRSISGDLHKYGFAPKPCSTILWRSQEEQSYHYLPVTEWPCGMYLSQGFVGSRPLAPIASIWALMHYLGREGYLENSKRLLQIRDSIVERVASIDGLKTWPTDGPLIQIASDEFDIQLVVGAMQQQGWRLLGVQHPPAIHLTVDFIQADDLERFLLNLETAASDIRSGKTTQEGLLSYGGVGDEHTAPKWLLSAIEIIESREKQKEQH